MVRTQIQLPDEVFAKAKQVCRDREISMAELARRGMEYMLSVYTLEPRALADWQPPPPRHLGWKGLSENEIRDQARITATELSLARQESD